jgi:hypothetical protein
LKVETLPARGFLSLGPVDTGPASFLAVSEDSLLGVAPSFLAVEFNPMLLFRLFSGAGAFEGGLPLAVI